MSTAITVFALAAHRLGIEPGSRRLTGADFERVELPMLGGCEACGASVAAYNACPSTTGYLRCANGCIDGLGYATVQEADAAIFGDA